MNKIETRHTCIIIHNYDMGDNESLERTFSIYDKLYHKYFPKGIYYDSEKKDLYLPSGIDLFYVIKSFGEDIFRKVQPDPFDPITPIKLRYPPRDETQQKAIRFCVGEGEYPNNKRATQISLNLNTGIGKTYVAITVAAYFSVRTMMITSSLDWINQWREKILEYTNLNDDEVYIIAGSTSIAKLLNGMKDISKIKFFLCSHDTFKAYANKYSWEILGELFKKLKIGIKIYDEAHLNFDSICMIDFFSDVWKTYYLTATPMRSDNREDFIYQISFKNVPKISLFDEDNDPHTEYIAILFNSHPQAIDINQCQNAYGFDRIKYTNYLITRPNYFKILKVLMKIVQTKVSSDGRVLIYIGTNFAISITYNWLKFYYPEMSIGIFSSLVPKEEKRNQLNNKLILTTTKSAGAALDIPNLELTIILNEPFKSQVLARQTLGRTRAKNTMYVDIVDVGFKTLKFYYTTKKKIFSKYATRCTEIQLSDFELNNRIMDIYREELDKIKEIQSKEGLKQVIEIVKK